MQPQASNRPMLRLFLPLAPRVEENSEGADSYYILRQADSSSGSLPVCFLDLYHLSKVLTQEKQEKQPNLIACIDFHNGQYAEPNKLG